MITLQQIQRLDEKVKTAVELISTLRKDNATLKTKLDEYQRRIGELEKLIDTFKRDQEEIENGIAHALRQLEALEDAAVGEKRSEPPATRARAVAKRESVEAGAEDETPAEDSTPEEAPETEEGELDIF